MPNVSRCLMMVQNCKLCYIVTDKLLKNLVHEALNRDVKENLHKAPCNRTSTHLDSLLNAIRSCGICFDIWEKKNADGKGSGIYDFTSIMGTEKQILLEKLPLALEGVITPVTSDVVIKLWKVQSFTNRHFQF